MNGPVENFCTDHSDDEHYTSIANDLNSSQEEKRNALETRHRLRMSRIIKNKSCPSCCKKKHSHPDKFISKA